MPEGGANRGAMVVVRGRYLCPAHGAKLVPEIFDEAWRQLAGAFELQGLGRPDRTSVSFLSAWGPPHNGTSRRVAAGAAGRGLRA